jgi:hypothetical protein
MNIPGLSRTDPTIPKQILEAKLKLVDQRRAEIEDYLATINPDLDSYHNQEIRAELTASILNGQKLRTFSTPKRSSVGRQNFRNYIKNNASVMLNSCVWQFGRKFRIPNTQRRKRKLPAIIGLRGYTAQ